MAAEPLTFHKKNYHSTKLKFLALKWLVTEHFKEYLPYQSFLVKTDNNWLTYIMMTPNLDATGHQWVSALVWFNFELEYQKGQDNTMVDALSWVTTHLDPDMVKSILDRVSLGSVHWAEVLNPTAVESDCSLGGTCHCRPHTCTNAHYWMGQNPERGPDVECSVELAEGTEEDIFKGTSGGTCLQWRRQTTPA